MAQQIVTLASEETSQMILEKVNNVDTSVKNQSTKTRPVLFYPDEDAEYLPKFEFTKVGGDQLRINSDGFKSDKIITKTLSYTTPSGNGHNFGITLSEEFDEPMVLLGVDISTTSMWGASGNYSYYYNFMKIDDISFYAGNFSNNSNVRGEEITKIQPIPELLPPGCGMSRNLTPVTKASQLVRIPNEMFGDSSAKLIDAGQNYNCTEKTLYLDRVYVINNSIQFYHRFYYSTYNSAQRTVSFALTLMTLEDYLHLMG